MSDLLAILLAARIASTSLSSLVVRARSITFPIVRNRPATAFFNAAKAASEVDFSTATVSTDLSLAVNLPAACSIGPLRSTILQQGHSPWACSVYRLSVNRYTDRGAITAQLSSPEKPVVYVTFAALVIIRHCTFFLFSSR
jgi:hypothetical protein